MSNKQLRNLTRIIHLITAVLIGLAIYSPLRADPTFMLLSQVLIIPVLTISGVVMWQQPKIMKLLRGSGGTA